jgi:hypothetical protein
MEFISRDLRDRLQFASYIDGQRDGCAGHVSAVGPPHIQLSTTEMSM